MSVWLLIGGGLIVLGHLIERWIVARAVAPIVQGVRRLRLASTKAARRERPAADHPGLGSHATYYELTSQQLLTRGFLVLGDLVEYRTDGTEAGVTRWFAVADGTIWGWFAMSVSPERPTPTPVMVLITELIPEGFVTTYFGSHPNPIAVPPTVHRSFIEYSAGLDAAVDAHRQGIAAHGQARVHPVDSCEGAVALLESARLHVNEWRARQPPAELLDLDLRGVLPTTYGKLHRAVKRAMPNHA
jgi:hypothetical protein